MVTIRNENIRKHLIPVLAGLILFPAGCLKEIPETFPSSYEWKPALAVPIGEAEFGLSVPYGFDTLLLELDTVSGFPLWSSVEEIPIQGSIDFNFNQVLGAREDLEYFILRVNTYNGFPVEGELQAFLYDETGEVIDSLFQPRHIMDRGQIKETGITDIPAHNQVDVLFDSTRLDRLLQVVRVEFMGTIDNVPGFPDYSFRVQIAGVAGIRYQL